jgi:type IV pilus assembly protein PilQ
VGDSQVIAVAEGYLKQIDLRKRQVAVKVQILNVDLTNDKTANSSFSARIGNKFIVSENGQAYMNFGKLKPGNSSGTGSFDGENIKTPARYPGGGDSGVEVTEEETNLSPDGNFSTTTSTSAPGDDTFDYPKNSFYSYLQSAIESTGVKTLAQPTLLVQEGQEAEVVTGSSVITSVERTDANNTSSFSFKRENAGLMLKVAVSKIDDNGFVSLDLDPTISVPEPAGRSEGVPIFNIRQRTLSSGSIRLRDRQTLVLTGVIQDVDREVVTKWPVLGELPLIGQLFRSSGSSRTKNELVILVTPSIVDDEAGGSYGYGYRPSTREARQMMGPS